MLIATPLEQFTEREVRGRYRFSAPRLAAEFVHLQEDVTLRAVLPLNRDSLVRGPRDGAQVVISKLKEKITSAVLLQDGLFHCLSEKRSEHEARPEPRFRKGHICWLRYRVARALGTTISIILEVFEASTTKRRTVGFGVPAWNRKQTETAMSGNQRSVF